MSADSSQTPQSPPRPAATVIIFRRNPSGGDPQLMMVERAAHMRFAGGASVFPGGQVDPADRTLAERLWPSLDPEDGAARVAAVRETLEETGLVLGVRQSVTPAAAAAARSALSAENDLAPVLERFGWVLEAERLVPFARWCPKLVRAFDTRFYLADLGTGDVALQVDGTENARLFWSSAAETLGEIRAGRLSAIFPTLRNLERLATYRSFAEAAAHAEAFPPRLIRPWIETIDGRDHLCIPEDVGYPITREPITTATRG